MRSIALCLAALTALPCFAAPILSEDFNDLNFSSGPGFENSSDRWAATTYTELNDYKGWSFTGSSGYARNDAAPDGAILLNEPNGAASHPLTGLTIGRDYRVSVLLWGDNIPFSDWQFSAAIDAVTMLTVLGTDQLPGTNPGAVHSFTFTATASSATLSFLGGDLSLASPIFDDVLVAAAVPEPANWAMMVGGFGLLGSVMRRRVRLIRAG